MLSNKSIGARSSDQRGLTLIEVAMAVGILAIMATLTWGSIARSFDAYETVTDIDRRYHNVRVAMNRMAIELSMAFLTSNQRHRNTRSGRKWLTHFKSDPKGDFHEIHFVSFSHQILRSNAKESDQNEISYFGGRDPDNPDVMNLMRREASIIDTEWEEGGRAYPLAENITSFKLRLWNDRAQDWVDEWDTENSEFQGRLPSFVEITMTINDEEGKELKFVTKTRINLQRQLDPI